MPPKAPPDVRPDQRLAVPESRSREGRWHGICGGTLQTGQYSIQDRARPEGTGYLCCINRQQCSLPSGAGVATPATGSSLRGVMVLLFRALPGSRFEARRRRSSSWAGCRRTSPRLSSGPSSRSTASCPMSARRLVRGGKKRQWRTRGHDCVLRAVWSVLVVLTVYA